MSLGQHARALGFWGADWLHHARVRTHLRDLRILVRDPSLREAVVHGRLQALLRHATATTQHFRPFRGAERLGDFPVLQKLEIRADYDAFLSSVVRSQDLFQSFTSGSYGTPLVFPLSADKRARELAELLFFTGWIGWRIGMPYLQVRAGHHSAVKQFLNNERIVDPTHMTPEWYQRGRHLLKHGGIRFLLGYPSAIQALAEYCQTEGDDPGDFQVEGACLGGEGLTPQGRQLMEATFGCPVRSRYAAMELGVIGQEPLRRPGRHLLNAASLVIEFLKLDRDEPAEPGQLGRIVVTDLFSEALPLIRYDTGDVGILSEQADPEFGLPVLEHLEGRQRDLIFDATGTPMTFLGFFNLFRDIPELTQCQLIQDGPARYTFRCILLPGRDPSPLILERMRSVLGAGAQITLERAAEIPPLASGKRPAILNRMDRAS